MNITERAAIVLQEIDAAIALAEKATPGPWESKTTKFHTVTKDKNYVVIATSKLSICKLTATEGMGVEDVPDATFIATARTLLPASLRCLKTAIEGLLRGCNGLIDYGTLTTLCDQWEAGR